MSVNLHNIARGLQDDYISKMSPYTFIGTFVETRTIILKGGIQRKSKIIFSNYEDAQSNYGYTNMRFNGDYNQILSIKLQLGGTEFDSIYPRITQKLSTFPVMDNNILPALNQSDGQILIEHSGDLEIKYDIMRITNFLKDNNLYEFLYNFTQFTGIKEVSGSSAKVKLYFDHPTTKITVITDHPISDAIMHLVTGHNGCPLTPVANGHNWTYEYMFDPTVNFSTIDCPFIECKLEKETKIAVFAQSLNVAKLNRDLIGVAYS